MRARTRDARASEPRAHRRVSAPRAGDARQGVETRARIHSRAARRPHRRHASDLARARTRRVHGCDRHPRHRDDRSSRVRLQDDSSAVRAETAVVSEFARIQTTHSTPTTTPTTHARNPHRSMYRSYTSTTLARRRRLRSLLARQQRREAAHVVRLHQLLDLAQALLGLGVVAAPLLGLPLFPHL